MRPLPVPTVDPFTGEELVVTRVENPSTGTVIEGRFTLGWMSRLTPEQLEFVGVLLARRNNLQRLASDVGIAYNTARNRFEDIVRALGGSADEDDETSSVSKPTGRKAILRRLAAGEIDDDEARRLLAEEKQDNGETAES